MRIHTSAVVSCVISGMINMVNISLLDECYLHYANATMMTTTTVAKTC
jgi:hypothetical protein